MKCPNCGHEAAPDEVFCGNCGARLKPAEPPPPPAPPAAPVKRGGFPVVPVVIGVVIVLAIICLCLLVAGLAGILAIPGLNQTSATPTRVSTIRTPIPTAPLPPLPQTRVTVATTTPPLAATPGVPRPGGAPLQIVSYVFRTDALSSTALEIMGEAVNGSNQDVNTGWYMVYVTLKDSSGNVVGVSKDLTTRLQRPIMKPGQKSCFRYFFDAKTNGFDLGKVAAVEADVQDAPDGHDAYTVELALSNMKRSGDTITGDITNNTQYATSSVFILLTFYDKNGKLTGVHYGQQVGDEKMAPGGKMSFTYSIIASDVADSYDVLVIAYKQ